MLCLYDSINWLLSVCECVLYAAVFIQTFKFEGKKIIHNQVWYFVLSVSVLYNVWNDSDQIYQQFMDNFDNGHSFLQNSVYIVIYSIYVLYRLHGEHELLNNVVE